MIKADDFALSNAQLSDEASRALGDPDYVLAFKMPADQAGLVELVVHVKQRMSFVETDLRNMTFASGKLQGGPGEVIQIINPDGTIVHCTNIGGVWRWL